MLKMVRTETTVFHRVGTLNVCFSPRMWDHVSVFSNYCGPSTPNRLLQMDAILSLLFQIHAILSLLSILERK
jgi:hypothetical protein